MPVICWKMKNTHTTIRARFTPAVQLPRRTRSLRWPAASSWRAVCSRSFARDLGAQAAEGGLGSS